MDFIVPNIIKFNQLDKIEQEKLETKRDSIARKLNINKEDIVMGKVEHIDQKRIEKKHKEQVDWLNENIAAANGLLDYLKECRIPFSRGLVAMEMALQKMVVRWALSKHKARPEIPLGDIEKQIIDIMNQFAIKIIREFKLEILKKECKDDRG